MIFADDPELFPVVRSPGCIRFDIGTCLAPCAAACTRGTYRKQVRAAQRFLSGRDTSVLAGLRRRMEACVKILAFEQAAALRDQLNLLEWLYNRLERVRQARAGRCFVYPVPGHAGEDRWYLIHHGVIVGVYESPKRDANVGTLRAALDCLAERKLPPGSSPSLRSLENVLLVAGWLRRHPAENRAHDGLRDSSSTSERRGVSPTWTSDPRQPFGSTLIGELSCSRLVFLYRD